MSSIGQGSISIDDSTRIGENAQDTADEAVGNVNDINSDNKLTPSEKLKLKQEYDKDVELYNIDIEQLKSVDLPTAELETAMSNLTDFVTPLFKEMNRTSTVDRDALDSVFTAFATADKNSSQAFVNMVQQVADDAKKAGDDAKEAGEKAQEAGEEAKASAGQAQADATQAKSDAATAQQKAQSSIDQLNEATTKFGDEITDAKNSAQKALDNITVVDSKVTNLSTSTTAQFNTLNNGYQEVISTVNNMDIGGRNIVLDSSNMGSFRIWQADGNSKLSDDKKEITITTSHGGINIEKKNLSEYLPNKGDTIVISADVKGNSHLQFNYNDGNNFVGSGTSIAVTTEYKRYFTTFEWNPVNLDKTEFVVYAAGSAEQYLTVKNVKVEIGNKGTDWSPAPEDFASQTQITTLNNLIDQKVSNNQYQSDKTQTANLISQTVKDVSGLKTEVNQVSDDVKILATTGGQKNLVYNSSYANNAKGWNMFNGVGYLSTVPASSYNGSPGFGVNVSGKGASTWTQFGESKHYTLPSVEVRKDNTYSASAMIKMYNDSDTTAKLAATIAYFDKNGVRITGWKDMIITYSQKLTWTEVKFENLAVPSGAVSVGMMFKAYGPKVHGMIAQPMIVFGPKIGPYNPDVAGQSDITVSINNIHMGIKGADGSTSTFNMNNNTILLDANKIIINGNTSIQNGTIGTAKIANAAINTAQIADGAINNAKIANAAINDAKISNLNGNKIVAGSITANKINVNDLIANGINTKTLTSVNLNTSTLTTPQLDLGLNGTFTEDFDYTQPTSMFLPKKNKGTLTFNHGVLQSKGRMQTYTGNQWGGMNDNYTFQAGIDNSQWTEVAPGYIKLDLFKQNDADVGQRTYIDPTGYYYTSRNGIATYLGNILQVSQVQTPSVLAKYIGPSNGELRLQIGSNGSHYGLQVGSYAGNEAVLSDFIYNSTTSGAPNINITANGHLVRSTSASKYKYNIKNPDIETTLGDRLLNVHLATWNDKRAVDMYAEQLSTGEEREKTSIDKYYGLIAEQLRDAGLDMFISYGKNHEIEGIQYDRAWVPLLSVIRRLNDKVNEYELRLSKLEGVSK
ncbi:hypothetical protein ACW5BZ_07960 [Pediococcus pentosaceus]